MKEEDKQVLKNKFKWTPLNERLDKIGQPVPPRKADIRKPKLWLTEPFRINNKDDLESYEVYLVNSSSITLESVIIDSGGWFYFDDELVNSKQKKEIEYKNVKDGDAIKVLLYQPFYDDDELTWFSLKIEMANDIIDFSTSYNQNTKRVDKEVVI